jgi:aldehyde dehydrogenase (NAD+)
MSNQASLQYSKFLIQYSIFIPLIPVALQKSNLHGLSLPTRYLFKPIPVYQPAHNGSTATVQSIDSFSPVDGKKIGSVTAADTAAYEIAIAKAQEAFAVWRTWPAPKRGEIVRQVGDALRANKEPLGKLVSYEMGKSLQEGYGEVQEMIDICDFAVGLSRQLYGLTMHSERPAHRMYEQWHPLGIVGIISAFNFPVAVWAWNSALSWVCGNVTIWKPSEKTPLCGVAVQNIIAEVFEKE